MDTADVKPEAKRGSSRLTRRQKVMMVTVIVAVLAPTIALDVPWYATPAHIRERGVAWEVYVEEPMPKDAVEGIMKVFAATVRGVLSIPTVSTQIADAPDDFLDNYTSLRCPETGFNGGTGPVRLTVCFWTGAGWDEGHGRAVLGRARRSAYSHDFLGQELRVGIDYYLPVKGCCSWSQTSVLLHEFGHNLGLSDLYEGNWGGIEGCEDFPVIMSNGGAMNPVDEPPSGELLFTIEETNTTDVPPWTEVRRSYFDESTGRLGWTNLRMFPDGTSRWSNVTYNLWLWRSAWTQEQVRYLGLPWTSEYSCPQEGLP